MKLAVVADIHANATAFMRVLDAATKAEVDGLIIAGDIVGYYFEPLLVLHLIQQFHKPIFTVRGNHEDMLLRASVSSKELEDITRRYGPGIKMALSELTNTQINHLCNLPHPLEINNFGCSILVSHGFPTAIDMYVYPDYPLHEELSKLESIPDVLIMGHTHHPFIKYSANCLIINPGSVGQPRNRIPGAHWTLLDTISMSAEALIEPYDPTDLINSCLKYAPDFPYLREVLLRS